MLWKEKNCTYWPYGTFYIIHTTYDKYQTIPCHQYYYYYNYDRHKKTASSMKKKKNPMCIIINWKTMFQQLTIEHKKRKQNQETDNKKLKFSHHMLVSKSWFIVLHNIQGVPSIGTHFRFKFLTFLMVLSKKANYAILTHLD